MNLDDMVLVSVDDHIIEPPTVFQNHVPQAWASRAPRLLYDAQAKVQRWTWEEGSTQTPFINAVVTLPEEEWGFDPGTLAEMRPACWDVRERVRDMDANGVLASMCFPSFAGMGGWFFASAKDRDLAEVCLRAYNDWHIDEWCGAAPGRFVPLPISPLWDPKLAADEVRRVARKGATAITFAEDPEAMGFASIHSGDWDPFFEACVDHGVTIAIHIGSSMIGPVGRPSTPIDVSVTLPCWNSLPCLANFLWCRSLQKYPDLRIALSEGGTSWIPGFLDRMERHFSRQKWTGADLGGLTPTEVFRRHFLACFISDPSGLLLRDRIGVDNIAYEVDYPHSDCTFPGSPEELWECFEDSQCSDEEIEKITYQNAARWLRFDPFAVVPREAATVGALRTAGAAVDLRTRSRREYAAAYEETHGPIR